METDAGQAVPSEALFGAESTKIEKGIGDPTCRLMWQDGVLMQMFKCTDRHSHYSGDHYNYATYHQHEEWKPVPGTPNTAADRAAIADTVEPIVGLAVAVRELFAVLDAHEIDTFDCDRAGVVHCDCLARARKKVESLMPNAPESA